MEGVAEAPHLAGARHLHAQQRVGAHQPRERELRHLDPHVLELVERAVLHPGVGAEHDAGGRPGVVAAGHLRDERQAAGRAQVALDHLHDPVAVQQLDVAGAGDPQLLRDLLGDAADLAQGGDGHVHGRQHERRVPAVDAGVLDVFADRPEHHLAPVRDQVDLDLPGVLLELGDDHRVLGGDRLRLPQDAGEFVVFVGDGHGGAAQHVARAHKHREAAQFLHDPLRVGGVGHVGPARLVHADPVQQGTELVAVLGAVDVLGGGAQNRNPGVMEAHRQPVRDLAAHAHHHPVRTLLLDEVQDRFHAHLVEDQLVADVVVGAHRLRVVVEHQGLEPELRRRLHGVHAAPVELDRGPDPVDAGADHQNAFPAAGGEPHPFVAARVVGGVEVVRLGGELGGQGVDPGDVRTDAGRPARRARLAPLPPGQELERLVRETLFLGLLEGRLRNRPAAAFDLRLGAHRFGDPVEEPRIDPGEVVDLGDRFGHPAGFHGLPERLGEREDAPRRRVLELVVPVLELEGAGIEPPHADVEHAKRLLEHFGEGAADGHHLPDALHLAADAGAGLLELAEVPAGRLEHQVVERRLEERLGDAGDGVLQVGQGEPEPQFRRHVGERIPGRLAGERRRAGEPGVHLDDPVVGARRAQRELHVAFAHDAEVLDRPDRDRAEELVLLVVQRLRRRHHQGLPGVDPHRVHVLHVADGDAVVLPVAHHLVLDFLPAAEGLLDEHLRLLRVVGPEDVGERGLEFGLRLDDGAPLAAQREADAQHQRQPDRERGLPRFVAAVADDAPRGQHADLREAGVEAPPILGVPDALHRGAEHLDPGLPEPLLELEAAVERGLAAEGERHAVHAFLLGDLPHEARGHRVQVEAVRHPLAGLDRRDVRIHEDGAHALLAQRLDGLGPRVVELAGLADLERPRAEDDDGLRFRRRLAHGPAHSSTKASNR